MSSLAQQFVGIWLDAHDKESELHEEEGNGEKKSNASVIHASAKYYHMSRKKLYHMIDKPLFIQKIVNYVYRDDTIREKEFNSHSYIIGNL